MELGFYHPDRGYWQAIAGDAANLLATYPAGTIQVPIRPGADHHWQGGQWVEVPAPLEELRVARLAALADKRWRVETGGVMVAGALVRTDATSQSKITGAVSLFDNDPELVSIDWEAQPGVWVTLDAASMRAIGIAVGRHVQACFSHARTLSGQIVAAEDKAALDAVDIEDGWPAV